MVGAVEKTNKIERSAKIKMSDSTEAMDDSVEKPLANGTGNKEDDNVKMEVDEPLVSNLPEDSKKETKDGGKSARRKSRSSSSVSNNSSSSGAAHTSSEKAKPEVVTKTDSPEEDFEGFEVDDFNILLLKMKKSGVTEAPKSADLPDVTAPTAEVVKEEPAVPKESTPEKPISPVEEETSASDASASRRSVRTTSSFKPKTPTVDISNPAFLKPFEHGWVREVVYRSGEAGAKRGADVYYHTPSGKKIRAPRDIQEHLTGSELTMDNFIFFRGPLGVDDPAKEIVRTAKSKVIKVEDASVGALPAKRLTPKVNKTPTGSPRIAPLDSAAKITTPKVAFRATPSSRKKPLAKPKLGEKGGGRRSEDVDVMVEREEWSPEPTEQMNYRRAPVDSSGGGAAGLAGAGGGGSGSAGGPGALLGGTQCSIKCRLALGLIPTLQCALCLCLFHPQCVAVSNDKLSRPSFVFKCKPCKSQQSRTAAAAVAAAAAAAAVTVSTSSNSSTPAPVCREPVLPPPPPRGSAAEGTGGGGRKPPGGAAAGGEPPTTGSSSGGGGGLSVQETDSQQQSTLQRPSIVGALTTWFSPTSSIQQGNGNGHLDENAPGIYVNPLGSTFIGFSRNTVVNVNTQESPDVNTLTNSSNSSSGLYLIPCDPQQLNGPQTIPLANGLKRPLDSAEDEKGSISGSPPEKRAKTETEAGGGPVVSERGGEVGGGGGPQPTTHPPPPAPAKSASSVSFPPANFMMSLSAGFTALLHAFQYLRVSELLRAAQVSKMWQFVASHHSLWTTVRMKNSRVSNWKGFAKTLGLRGTQTLDLRKMLVPDSVEEQTKMWEELTGAVKEIKTLKRIDLGRCTPTAFVRVAAAAPQLESLVSMAIKGNEMDLGPVANCKDLKELRLKTVLGTLEILDLSCLSQLTNLTTLALTTIKNLKGIENYLPENLRSLELGECNTLSTEVATLALPKLHSLKRLRLEKGCGDCPTLQLLEAISTLPQLSQLELINFDIKPGFDKALAKCTNLKTLLVIPTYVTQSATTNHVVLGGVTKLSQTLTYFIWGLTLELLKVTDLFIGQVENQKASKTGTVAPKKGCGDSIPILKPNNSAAAGGGEESKDPPSQVDILALPNLQRVLSTLLPSTKIKILKVPFSATWRQTVTDN